MSHPIGNPLQAPDEAAASPALPAALPEDLPVVPLERFLQRSDAPGAPMVFRVLLRFDGTYRRDLLTQAFDIAIRRQPLLISRLTNRGNGLVWHPADQVPVLSWETPESPETDLSRMGIAPLDLSFRPGVRARVFEVDQGITILLDINHLCCDGQGARQLLGEWFGVYDQLLTGSPVKLVTLKPQELLNRAQYRQPTPPIGLFEGLRNFWLTIRGRTVHVPARTSTQVHDWTTDHLREVVLSVEETKRLRKQLKQARCSVNDIGLTSSFLAFAEIFPELCHRDFITILNPTDLRWPSDLKTPACNRVGVTFIRRRRRDWNSGMHLLQTIHAQLKYVKKRYVGAEFLRGLAMTESSAGLQGWLERRGYFRPTLQFTCLGDTTRAMHYRYPMVDGVINFQGARLQRISGFMQTGTYLPISLAACETNQRLALTVHGRNAFVSAEQTERLLNLMVQQMMQLGELMASEPSPPQAPDEQESATDEPGELP